MKHFLVLLIVSIVLHINIVKAQTGSPLPHPLNTPLSDEFFPSISADGKTLIILSNYGADKPYPMLSYLKGGLWTRPEEITSFVEGNWKLNNNNGFNLSPDGKTIIFSSNKYGGVGKNDIWIMEKSSKGWQTPKNLAKPINTIGNEGDPSISPDGKSLYFIRYADKKTTAGTPCGKIYVAQKVNKDYKEPVELPAAINTGCECSPRILSDGKTLYFSSQRSGGKGGLDLYVSRMKPDGSWSKPEPLSFLNTPNDDVNISVPASGETIYFTVTINKSKDVSRIKIPQNLQQQPVVLIDGRVVGSSGTPLSSLVHVTNANSKKLLSINNTVPGEESYFIILPKGDNYDLGYYAAVKGHYYNSSYLKLDTLSKFQLLTPTTTIEELKPGKEFILNSRLEALNDINPVTADLDKLAKVMQENPTLKTDITIFINDIEQVISDTTSTDSATVVKEPTPDPTQKEAEAISAYLAKKGITSSRATVKGEGKRKDDAVQELNSQQRIVKIRIAGI